MKPATALLLAIRAFGLSQTQISRRTKIAQPKLSRWESGAAPSSADDALKLQTLLIELQAEAKKKERRAARPSAPKAAA